MPMEIFVSSVGDFGNPWRAGGGCDPGLFPLVPFLFCLQSLGD